LDARPQLNPVCCADLETRVNRMQKYIAGPLFLAKPTDHLPPGALSVSECVSVIAPSSWAIDWVQVDAIERSSEAAACGIPESRLPEVISWVTDHFGHGFAWPRSFLNMELAHEFHSRFLPSGFHLLQVALPEGQLEQFLALAAPPAQQAGYAPNGGTAVYEALAKRQHVSGGELLGFDILGYERYAGGFESFRCYRGLPEDFARLGAAFNTWGYLDDEEVAFRCAELVSKEGGTCADAWHPWLVVEHALSQGRTTMR
jgi:hypothetical protein